MLKNRLISKHTTVIRIVVLHGRIVIYTIILTDMGRITLVLVFVGVIAVCSEARHVHPRSEDWGELTEERIIDLGNASDGLETEVINIVKPKKTSPFSSILFFKSYNPCEDGFKLDYQGICREVWF